MFKLLTFIFSLCLSFKVLANVPEKNLALDIKFSVEKCSYDPIFYLGCSQMLEEKKINIQLSECIDYANSKLCSGQWKSESVRDDLFFGVTLIYYNQFDLNGNLLEETLYGILQSGKDKDTAFSNFSIYLDGSKLTVPLRIGGATVKVVDEVKEQTHLYKPQIYIAPGN